MMRKFCYANLLLISILPFFFSCGGMEKSETPAVVFSQPQPSEGKNLSEFPRRLKGDYRGMAEGNLLQITDKFIISTAVWNNRMRISDLDSNAQLKGDTITNLKTGEKIKVEVKGDSLFHTMTFIDTLFRLNYDNVLRKFRGHFFLNTRYEGESWEVKKLSPEGNRLIIGSIRSAEDIQTLETISEAPADTILPRKFNLSQKQFRKYLGKEGFRDQSVYLREGSKR